MLELHDLTPAVRHHMLAEIMMDEDSGNLFLSDRLTPEGRQEYPGLLRQAAESYDSRWLTDELGLFGRLVTSEVRPAGGGLRPIGVPSNAAEMLADGEFNRFYIRGLCRYVLASTPDGVLEVYRAKGATNPKPESEAKIGQQLRADELLTDLRAHNGNTPGRLGVPSGPNSGLSVRLPD